MSEYIYSAKNNAFYPVNMKEDYVEAGSWPDDGKDVSEDCFLEFTSVSHTDKYRVAGEDGLPSWDFRGKNLHEATRWFHGEG